jgi:hypothetical protein
MTVYTNLINTAYRLVDKFGQNMTVNVVTDGTPPDPSQPWNVAAGTTVSHSTRGVMLDFRPDQVEGYAYQRGDKLVYIAAKDLPVVITEEMFITDASGVSWAIISASRVYPSGEDILFQLYVREWPRRYK